MTLRALVVDDSPMLRKSVVAALRRIEGMSCAESGDGGDALKRLTRESFDILITDINMPVMDGLKLIAAVRQPPVEQTLPIIVITTESAEQDRARALALGANRYMVKPVQAPDVMAAVRELLHLS